MGWDHHSLLGVSLEQHLAQQEQGCSGLCPVSCCPFMSCDKGKDSFLPPCSARGSSRRNCSLLLLWVCSHTRALSATPGRAVPWELGLLRQQCHPRGSEDAGAAPWAGNCQGGLVPTSFPVPEPTLWHRDLLSWSLLLWLELGQILLCWVGSPKSLLLPLASHPSCSVPATADP